MTTPDTDAEQRHNMRVYYRHNDGDEQVKQETLRDLTPVQKDTFISQVLTSKFAEMRLPGGEIRYIRSNLVTEFVVDPADLRTNDLTREDTR